MLVGECWLLLSAFNKDLQEKVKLMLEPASMQVEMEGNSSFC